MIDIGEALFCRRILKMKTINFIKKNQYLLGIVAIVISFIIVRLPYFLYMPIPFINGDAFEYNRVINLLESDAKLQIGFPGIGYPLLILICESIKDTTAFFFFVQSVLQLLAVLLFYHYYKVYIKKYLLYVAILLIGYLTSNINLYYDTAYHPDSFVGSLFIVSIALFIRIIFKPSYLYFVILSFVILFSIAVRANGIILFPIIFCYLIYIFINTKSFKQIFKLLGIFLIPTFILCCFHYFNPIYKTFNIISYQSKIMASGGIYAESIQLDMNNEIWKKVEKFGLNHYFYTDKINSRSIFNDTNFVVYVMAQQRGYSIQLDKNNDVIIENFNDTRNKWETINLRKLLWENKKNEYLEFKKFYKKEYNNHKLVFSPPIDLHHKLMHFVGFFKLFYQSIDLDGTVLGYENKSFYDENIKMRYGNIYNELILNSNIKNKKRVYKELYAYRKLSKTQLLLKIDDDIWKFKISKYYRYILKPFYKIQPLLFRNFCWPILFIGVYLFSVFGLFYTKLKSKIFVFSVISGSLLIITNILFSIYFCYSYTRYTYQVSFIYYVTLIILPILIQEFRKGKKLLNSNA